MNLIVYEVTREKDIDRKLGEESELIQFGSLPKLLDHVQMGSDRDWEVVHIEPYYRACETLYVVMVSRADLPLSDLAEWTASFMRQRSPNLSFDVQLSPERTLLKYGWSLEGKAPIGQLLSYSPTGEETKMQAESMPWVIDHTDTYRPAGEGIYAAIHLGWCSPIKVANSFAARNPCAA